jgi:hypothetical protein
VSLIKFDLGDEKVKPWLENAIYLAILILLLSSSAFIVYQFLVKSY